MICDDFNECPCDSNLPDLLEQRAELEKKISAVRAEEQRGAIAKVRALISTYELQHDDVFGDAGARGATIKMPVAAKYEDRETGAKWSGRGRAPKWLEGKNREDFLVEKQRSARRIQDRRTWISLSSLDAISLLGGL